MKLVAVSVVKNEADIIEAFVRHTHAWVDHHLVFDHDSTDGTREILAVLVREGLPLTLFHGDCVANLQQSRSNHLARVAFEHFQADWALPLDADEILAAPSRAAFEQMLGDPDTRQPVQLALHNYAPTTADNPVEPNPVLRLAHRRRHPSSTVKVFVPRRLGLTRDVAAGKGNHVLFQSGQPLTARPLEQARLAHFALRSPEQQALRVLTAELQKLSRGRAHDGLDLHYRLGFQRFAEDPAAFFSSVFQSPDHLVRDPAPYLGGPLRYHTQVPEVARTTRAFIPFLEQLARSHGALSDTATLAREASSETIRILDLTTVPPPADTSGPAFSHFTPATGWEPAEGPVPEAFLPRFHWATGPETVLTLFRETDAPAHLRAEALTYSPEQSTIVVLNDTEILHHAWTRVNQKETLTAPLALRAGENRLTFRHAQWLTSDADPRKLALIFLSLRILG